MTENTHTDQSDRLAQISGFLTYRISRLHGKLNGQASRILEKSVGITLNQWRMMAFIGSAENLTASELISHTSMDKGMVSRNVKSLIEMGLVASLRDEGDRRVHFLALSPAGREIYDAALPRMRRRQADLKKDISEQDMETFFRVMAMLEVASENTDIL